ncbi:unnamed protein product [Linum tenue]|uniref:Uncharacterized protein n=1 Tax=Linum tenue TaxID=586396 RepID=A0AAV0J4T8_9ROSI|nr:unnamed protein product [Linum tenue]CAI0551515.1 unnamed protein product [Linum tenue]
MDISFVQIFYLFPELIVSYRQSLKMSNP